MLVDRETSAAPDRAAFYKEERAAWSEQLARALEELTPDATVRDVVSQALAAGEAAADGGA